MEVLASTWKLVAVTAHSPAPSSSICCTCRALGACGRMMLAMAETSTVDLLLMAPALLTEDLVQFSLAVLLAHVLL